MMECPGTDALATVAEALDWNTDAALEHMRTCGDCKARMATIAATHAAFAQDEEVPEYVVARISDAIGKEARAELASSTRTERNARLIEAVLAGATAIVLVLAFGTPSGNVAALTVTFLLGALVPFVPAR